MDKIGDNTDLTMKQLERVLKKEYLLGIMQDLEKYEVDKTKSDDVDRKEKIVNSITENQKYKAEQEETIAEQEDEINKLQGKRDGHDKQGGHDEQ